MEIRGTLDRLGLGLSVAAAMICLALHIATFLTVVSLIWIILPFFLVAGAILCARVVDPKPRFGQRLDRAAIVGWVLLFYALCWFAYDYRTTGGATSVGIADGHYVSMYKDRTIKIISENEYRMIPNLWTRVMSAWVAMMAVFCAKSFTLPGCLCRGT